MKEYDYPSMGVKPRKIAIVIWWALTIFIIGNVSGAIIYGTILK